jgi:hypothetical protein
VVRGDPEDTQTHFNQAKRDRQTERQTDRQTVESECLTEYREQKKREFKQKREEHCSNTMRGVNISQMSQVEMRKVREGLADLFKTMINLLIKEFQLKRNDWEGW